MGGVKPLPPCPPAFVAGKCRVHVTGASGAGTTTLGRALAQRLAVPHFDTDDFFWLPTEPPFQHARERGRRLALLEEMLGERRGWVLSGALDGWGDPLASRFDLVVWLDTPSATRLKRLAARERTRYGRAALAPDGAMYEQHRAFLDWAASYDTRTDDGRGRRRHEQWLAGLTCKVLRLDGSSPTRELVRAVAGGVPIGLRRSPPPPRLKTARGRSRATSRRCSGRGNRRPPSGRTRRWSSRPRQ